LRRTHNGNRPPERLYTFTTIALRNVGSSSWFRERTMSLVLAAGWSTSAAGTEGRDQLI
jgi:hypothetical protein